MPGSKRVRSARRLLIQVSVGALVLVGAAPAWLVARSLLRVPAPPSAAYRAEAGRGDAALRGVAALGRIQPRHGTSRVAGPPELAVVIEKLLVEKGDRVERGQVLALLQGIGLHQADVARCAAELAHAERELQREQGLEQRGAAAQAQLEAKQLHRDVSMAALERAQAELDQSRVRAPISGQVLEIHAREGERVDSTDGILELGDTAAMYAVAEVYETDIARVRVNQRARVRSPALPSGLSGRVERIGLQIGKKDVLGTDPVADADARVVEVEVRLDDPEPAAALTNLRVDVVFEP